MHIQLATQRGRCILGTGCCFTSFERQIARTPSHLARRSPLYTVVQHDAADARGNYFLPRRRKAMVVSPRIPPLCNQLPSRGHHFRFVPQIFARACRRSVRATPSEMISDNALINIAWFISFLYQYIPASMYISVAHLVGSSACYAGRAHACVCAHSPHTHTADKKSFSAPV